MKIRLDFASVFEYAVLFVLLWLIFQNVFFQIPPLEAAPEEGEPVFCSVPRFCPAWFSDVNLETFAQRFWNFTRKDLNYVIRTIACEAPHEPLSGIRAVVHVIKTRTAERGLSYADVVTESRLTPQGYWVWQFSCWADYVPLRLKNLRDRPRETLGAERYNELKWIALGVMLGDLSDPFPGANLYYSHCSIAPPFWAYRTEYLGSIGCHSFYKSE